MSARRTYSVPQLAVWLALLTGAFFLLGVFDAPRNTFVSHEVTFTHSSSAGLAIMPASCASNPSYYHITMATTTDSKGYVSPAGSTEYGAIKFSTAICITNTTGANYFVPAETAAEWNAVKALGTSIPGVTVW